ncbi:MULTISPECIES: hypothetical protein [unclassified Mesorhizobium]|nr:MULTISPECIES: hypothetical protein [unclassified Mesorhizobium]
MAGRGVLTVPQKPDGHLRHFTRDARVPLVAAIAVVVATAGLLERTTSS